MKKRIWLWVVKISAVLIWALTLFIPDVYMSMKGDKFISFKEVDQESETVMVFRAEYSEKIIYGHVAIGFFDENNEKVYEQTIFYNNDSRVVEFRFEDENLSKYVFYVVDSLYAKSINEKVVDIITAWVSAFMLVVVILVLRIDFEEYAVDEKKVEVYSGLLKHQVKVDGEKVFKKNWFTLFKGREIVLNVSEEKDAKVKFSSMNKIDVEIADKQNSGEILKESDLVGKEDVENVELREKNSQKEKVAKKKK